MIKGLGTDLVEIPRLAEKMSKDNGLRELIFSPAEIAYCESKTNKFEHYAARFAAKEAFFKALGTGWLKGTAFNEVQVLNNDEGKPLMALSGKTLELVNKAGQFNIFVSLTHVKIMASAVVILELYDV